MKIYKNYNANKGKILSEMMTFCECDDLTHLAEAVLIGRKILTTNHFPIGKYKKWIKSKKQ